MVSLLVGMVGMDSNRMVGIFHACSVEVGFEQKQVLEFVFLVEQLLLGR